MTEEEEEPSKQGTRSFFLLSSRYYVTTYLCNAPKRALHCRKVGMTVTHMESFETR